MILARVHFPTDGSGCVTHQEARSAGTWLPEGVWAEILDFTSKVHRVQPELAVFLANDWGAELLMGLQSLERLEMPSEMLHR